MNNEDRNGNIGETEGACLWLMTELSNSISGNSSRTNVERESNNLPKSSFAVALHSTLSYHGNGVPTKSKRGRV